MTGHDLVGYLMGTASLAGWTALMAIGIIDAAMRSQPWLRYLVAWAAITVSLVVSWRSII